MTCASCGQYINKKGYSDEFYKNRWGNYCLSCMERISKNCNKHYQENLENFNYAFQTRKSVDNLKVWRENGYLSH